MDFKNYPTKEFKYFVYDPEDNCTIFFKTEEARDKCAEGLISSYCNDGWCDLVEYIFSGIATHGIVKFNEQKRPEPEDFETEEEYEAAVDDYPDMGYETCCEYKMEEL